MVVFALMGGYIQIPTQSNQKSTHKLNEEIVAQLDIGTGQHKAEDLERKVEDLNNRITTHNIKRSRNIR